MTDKDDHDATDVPFTHADAAALARSLPTVPEDTFVDVDLPSATLEPGIIAWCVEFMSDKGLVRLTIEVDGVTSEAKAQYQARICTPKDAVMYPLIRGGPNV